MAEVTIYHNPKCSTSNHALGVVTELGVDHEVVQYLKTPPDRETLSWIIDHLEDPVGDLVRKDALFERLGLNADDYTDKESVIELLLREPKLMQRPVLVKGDVAIIGRPKERVRQLLEAG